MRMPLGVLLGIWLIACCAGFGADGVSVWRESAARFNDTRVTYLKEMGPSRMSVECLRNQKGAPQTIEEVRYRTRAWATASQCGSMRRYERRVEYTPDITVAAPQWEVAGHYEQARTPTDFRYLDKLQRSAAIWSQFRWDAWTLLDAVTPPAESDGTFGPVEKDKHVWEFHSADGKRVVRYQLDPNNGMMPVRIETYQAANPLFLYQIVEIRRYEKCGETFFPAEAVVYNNMGGKADTWDSVDTHSLKKAETSAGFTPADFTIEVGPDVTVSDHRVKE